MSLPDGYDSDSNSGEYVNVCHNLIIGMFGLRSGYVARGCLVDVVLVLSE